MAVVRVEPSEFTEVGFVQYRSFFVSFTVEA